MKQKTDKRITRIFASLIDRAQTVIRAKFHALKRNLTILAGDLKRIYQLSEDMREAREILATIILLEGCDNLHPAYPACFATTRPRN